MPKLNGVELAKMIRRENDPAPYIIALSSFGGFTEEPDIFDCHLLKPVKQSKLLRALVGLYKPRSGRTTDKQPISLANIIVVDDNTCNRFVIKELLKSCKIPEQNITVLESGTEAIELLSTDHEKYDILLMDLRMPIVDGYMVCDFMREHNIEMYTIATTAHSTQRERDKCLKLYSMDDFLPNPMILLKQKIRTKLE